MGFPGGTSSKASACNAGDTRDAVSIPELGRSPGRGHGNPLQYPCLEDLMDRGAWWSPVHGSTESNTTERLSTTQHTSIKIYLKPLVLWGRL